MAEIEDWHAQTVVIDVEDLLITSMNHKLSALDIQEQEADDYCTIHRVLPTVRNEDPGSYDPKIISIGPFHRDKEHLKPMESLKWRYLHDLIHRSPHNSLPKYVNVARTLVPKAQKCYSEPIDMISAFAETMVLDGCFIIELLIKLMVGVGHRGRLYSVNWNLPLLMNDLLLLENQIPFFLLQSLFDASVAPELSTIIEDGDSPVTLVELALNYVTLRKMTDTPIPKTIHHLLHLFHSTLSPPKPLKSKSPVSNANSTGQGVIGAISKAAGYFFLWLVSLLFYCSRLPEVEQSSRMPRRIPRATELREAGVNFFEKRNSRGLLDVSFVDGDMELPLLSVQAATIPRFRNLVAFEQACPTAGSHFTSYVALMDNLIDTPEDVVLLERCGVIESKLGGSKEVAAFFNSLGKGGYLDYDRHYLAGVFKDVREFSAIESNRWRAMLMHDYFSNPWTRTSLAAAIILLCLTAVQSFFAIFAYLRPP